MRWPDASIHSMAKDRLVRPALVALLAATILQPATAHAGRPQATPGGGPTLTETQTASRSVRVMDYAALITPLTITFRYTRLAPGSAGQAEVEPGKTALKIHAAFTGLPPAGRIGSEYLTYVMWAVAPNGRTTNLGEIQLAGSDGKLDAKVVPRRFGLIITAEPYFAVSQPGSTVIFEADLVPGATPNIPVSQATCELLRKPIGAEAAVLNTAPAGDPAIPLVLEEVHRAIATARNAGAQQYAPDTLATAEHLQRLALDQQARGVPKKDVMETGVEAVLIAEDARVLAVARQKRARETSSSAALAP